MPEMTLTDFLKKRIDEKQIIQIARELRDFDRRISVNLIKDSIVSLVTLGYSRYYVKVNEDHVPVLTAPGITYEQAYKAVTSPGYLARKTRSVIGPPEHL